MKIAKKYIDTIWSGSIIIIALVIGYINYSGYKFDLQKKLSIAENSITEMKADLGKSQEVVLRYSASRDEIQPYLNTLFPAERPDDLIKEIRKSARRNNARLADIKLDVPKFIEIRGRNESISIVPFEISFTGSFFSLGRFLEDFEKSPFLQEVSQMGISIQNDTGSALKLSMKGAFRFFSRETVEELIADGN
ncbi:MAG: hypothetical protein V3W18_05145 [candidate division Zixibacteria bacterium]